MANKTVTINGKLYDATTGLPVKTPTTRPAVKAKTSKKISVSSTKKISVSEAKSATKPKTPSKKIVAHRPARSQTLNRKAVKKPPVKPVKPTTRAVKPAQKAKLVVPSIATRPSPVVPRPTRSPRRPVSLPDINHVTKATVASKTPQTSKKHGKATVIALAILAIMIGGGIAIYLFVPPVSFWVASVRADVKAKLPVYAPSGYHVDGTAESSPGQVTVRYKSSENGEIYSLTEQNSTWDSKGVLENKVKPNSKNYQTLSQKGLTIYRFDGKAIWVNGGVLYTISDDNNLSNDQILQIIDSI